MATTKTWYIAAATGAKVDFTDPSADIDFTGDDPVAKRELQIVKTEEGGNDDHPTVVLWKAEDQVITDAEITAAIADQDDAAVPTLQQAADDPSGTRGDAITAIGAVMADIGAAPSQANFNALLATVRTIRTAVNALIESGEDQGELDEN